MSDVISAPARRTSSSSGMAKAGGFPCRYGNCDERFFVARQDSMTDLLEASKARTEHETRDHDYHHKSWEVEQARPFSAGPAPRPKGPRRPREMV